MTPMMNNIRRRGKGGFGGKDFKPIVRARKITN